jgi:hypothetical protein
VPGLLPLHGGADQLAEIVLRHVRIAQRISETDLGVAEQADLGPIL